MSESTVGVVEQELLDRTRERLVAARCGYYRQLEDIAELDQRGVALATGDRVVDRLVQDLGSFDPAEANAWSTRRRTWSRGAPCAGSCSRPGIPAPLRCCARGGSPRATSR